MAIENGSGRAIKYLRHYYNSLRKKLFFNDFLLSYKFYVFKKLKMILYEI